MNYALYEFPIQTNSIFIGLIIGTIPSLVKEVNEKEQFELRNVIYLLIALGIGIITVILENTISIGTYSGEINNLYLIICGMIMSIGIIVPGVSSTIILMLLGVYSVYLQSIANINLPVLIPMGMGLVLGSIIVMKITKKLLEKYYAQTFYSIIGFTIGSIFVLVPQGMTALEIILSGLCIILGIYISHIPDAIRNIKNSKVLKSVRTIEKLKVHSKAQDSIDKQWVFKYFSWKCLWKV